MTETVWSKTKAMLTHRGWSKGAYMDTRGGFCLLGAARAMRYEEVGRTGAVFPSGELVSLLKEFENNFATRVAEHLGNVGHPGFTPPRTVAWWNDAPERKREDVFTLLDELHEKELAEKGAM